MPALHFLNLMGVGGGGVGEGGRGRRPLAPSPKTQASHTFTNSYSRAPKPSFSAYSSWMGQSTWG
jgi:hypothetical protein